MKDKKEIVDLLEKADFEQDWEGYQSMLQLTLAVLGYFTRTEEIFNKSFSFLYTPITNGLMSGLISKESYKEFGMHLVGTVSSQEDLDKMCQKFKNVADDAKKLMDVPLKDFLDSLEDIRDIQHTYLAYQIATKTVSNFLPKDTDESIFKQLEDARKYSEDFYKVSNQKITEVIGLLKKDFPDYSDSELQSVTVEELLDHTRNGKQLPDKEILQQRYKKSGVFSSKDGYVFLDAHNVEEIEKVQAASINNQKVTGTTAFKGVVRGRCRVINEFKDAVLEQGDILVTGMTDPQFVPLMKKAGAIVTDGGGMLCHAAIVAREMKKPCVIGTKHATKVFKDGMEIEVDANKGVVKIL